MSCWRCMDLCYINSHYCWCKLGMLREEQISSFQTPTGLSLQWQKRRNICLCCPRLALMDIRKYKGWLKTFLNKSNLTIVATAQGFSFSLLLEMMKQRPKRQLFGILYFWLSCIKKGIGLDSYHLYGSMIPVCEKDHSCLERQSFNKMCNLHDFMLLLT